jgi:hypothetical protein
MRRSKSAARRSSIRNAATWSSAAVAVLTAVASLGTLGCEDGPNQTYTPASPGASNTWNNSGSSYVAPGSKDFGYLHGGTNANVLCDGPTLARTWAAMDQQPIVPPISGGGLDLAGADCSINGSSCSWNGLTIEQAEKVLCQSTNLGDLFGDGELANSWGDSTEVIAHYGINNHKIDFMLMLPGYLGTLNTQGCSGTASDGHQYTIPIGVQLQKDNQNWEIDWAAPKGPGDWRNEVTSAILCTYAPTLAHDPDCNASGRCIQGSFGDVAYIFIPLVGIGLWIPSQSAAQPQPSILNRIDLYLSKVTPFAAAAPNLKIDSVGPVAVGGVLNQALGQPCNMQFGSTYSDFLAQCVQATGNPQQDTAELNKLIGGISHSTERFSFDITGVDMNFADSHLASDQVVNDTDLPQKDDISSQFSIDQSTVGNIEQDFVGNDPTTKKDAHGAGLVYLQMARLAQRDLTALAKAKNPSFPSHFIGDPACADPNPAPGCTGMETIITTTPQALITATQSVGSASSSLTTQEVAYLVNGGIPAGTDIMADGTPTALTVQRLGLKPGTANIVFCADHTKLANCPKTYIGLSMPTAYARVQAILGGGQVSALPTEAQDIRFYFKEYVRALIQYLKAEGAATTAGKDPSAVTIADVDAQTINQYSIFFDSLGAGQFEEAEYIERSTATDTQPPIDFIFSADVKHGIMNGYDFSRYLYRGETALYTGMVDARDGQDHPLGSQDTALLTNMFGSPVLHAGWADHTADSGAQYTAYYCATHNDPHPCKSQVAPLDANGNMLLDEAGAPLLSHYEGAFAGAATAFTLGGGATPSTPVAVLMGKGGPNGDGTYPNIQSAMIEVPLHANPYDLTSAPPPNGGASIQKLVNWAPKQPGIGFPVALDGERNKFIESYQMDLSGTQITANIDYDFRLDANGNPTAAVLFLAVETTDFLGDLFVCQDKTTGDLLTARMYTSVSSILDWLAAHPTAYDDCQLILQYSPYANYLDYVNSLANGVRLGVTQGGGYGRIVDGTLFDPSLPNH